MRLILCSFLRSLVSQNLDVLSRMIDKISSDTAIMKQSYSKTTTKELCKTLVARRRNHPAWLLLASRNSPLTVACLKQLLDAHSEGIEIEDTVEELAQMFAEYANDSEFDIDSDHVLAARREIRKWLKRGLIVERDGLVMATDPLLRALRFLDSLEDQAMTSTASRLATVQRAIESLEVKLSRNQSTRAEALKKRIESLQDELDNVEAGNFEVLSGRAAEEEIQEVYQLAISLRDDFKRVEDSYREADRSLRQRMISQQQNRGDIVDELLDSHEALVQTNEGQVFDGFYQQLRKSAELEQMKHRLRSIMQDETCDKALQRKQKNDLRLLVSRLVQESERVIQARARSERDVSGFLKSGLADEQIRVGAILQEIFNVALRVDWTSQKIRRTPAPLPPIGISASNLPLVERLLARDLGEDGAVDLDFTVADADPQNMGGEFWDAWQALDRAELFEKTIAQLKESGKPLSLGELSKALPPTHDLETLAYWLAMAREAGIEITQEREVFELVNDEDEITRFDTPLVMLDEAATEKLEAGKLE